MSDDGEKSSSSSVMSEMCEIVCSNFRADATIILSIIWLKPG